MESNVRKIKFDKVVLDCRDPQKLADFYIKLLGWQKGYDKDGFVIIGSPTSNVDIGFQQNIDYVQPTWPERDGLQQQCCIWILQLKLLIKSIGWSKPYPWAQK